ncbi:MAG: rod shape-determining protein MreD [Gammaproteobacteria bacterium]
MIRARRQGGSFILFSFALSLLLSVIALPEGFSQYRPDMTGLVLIYWCLFIPERISVGTGWLVGLCLDILKNTLLGQHALGLAIMAFFANTLHRQIRVYPFWQQAGSVLIFLLVHQLISLWVNSLTGQHIAGWPYWIPSLAGIALWPFLYAILHTMQRFFSIK